MDVNHTLRQGRLAILILFMLLVWSISGWLTFRQGGMGASLATLPGSILLAHMFFSSGLISIFLLTTDYNILLRFTICVFATATIATAVVVIDNGGFKYPDDVLMNAIVFTAILWVQHFVVSILRPIANSTNHKFQFSRLHILYVTTGFAILSVIYQLAGEIGNYILIGLLFGGLTMSAFLTGTSRWRIRLGIPSLVVCLVFSCFLHLFVPHFVWGPFAMTAVGLIIYAILVFYIIVLPRQFMMGSQFRQEIAS